MYFDTDIYSLTKTEKTRLQKFLSSLSKDEVLKIEIYGFCDDKLKKLMRFMKTCKTLITNGALSLLFEKS